MTLPSIETVKDQAKRLRSSLGNNGQNIGHSKALELMAQQYGYKDWNTLNAKLGNRPPPGPVELGQHVQGHYLGKPFAGEVLAVRRLNGQDRFRVTFQFEEPVDVVEFDSFSAFRQRVTCTIGNDGKTIEKTSNGEPQMQLSLR